MKVFMADSMSYILISNLSEKDDIVKIPAISLPTWPCYQSIFAHDRDYPHWWVCVHNCVRARAREHTHTHVNKSRAHSKSNEQINYTFPQETF